MENLLKNTLQIEERLKYAFKNKSLLLLAFTHRSYINENKQVKEHNERLEFLGDSVLGILVAEYLYCHLPSTSEGDLSYLRSRLVEATSCVTYMLKLDVSNHLLLGKGEKMNDGRGRESILADLFEAIIGAIYLDGGIDAAKAFFFGNFKEEIEAILNTPIQNWKALLQDFCQKKFQQPPEYKTLKETGPDHSKIFVVSVELNGEVLGQGEGPSKKEAQQAAARSALEKTVKSQVDEP